MNTSKQEKPQDLEERTYEFALRTRLLLKQREWDPTSWSDVQQLLRSSGSVASNYLEAQDALSSDDFIYRNRICRKEARESGLWLNLLRDTNELSDDQNREIDDLIAETHELRKIFSAIILRRLRQSNE